MDKFDEYFPKNEVRLPYVGAKRFSKKKLEERYQKACKTPCSLFDWVGIAVWLDAEKDDGVIYGGGFICDLNDEVTHFSCVNALIKQTIDDNVALMPKRILIITSHQLYIDDKNVHCRVPYSWEIDREIIDLQEH